MKQESEVVWATRRLKEAEGLLHAVLRFGQLPPTLAADVDAWLNGVTVPTYSSYGITPTKTGGPDRLPTESKGVD